MRENTPEGAPHGGARRIHPDVLWLGLVSFLTDVSSEAVFSVFSIFFTTIAGASAALLGIVEGTADFAASSLDYLSGWLSDRSGSRKGFAVLGYGFSAAAKGILLVASSASSLALFRVIERLGKSFRGPPRDAWLSDVAAEADRGYSFGVHKAMDKAGAVVGPLLAFWLLTAYGSTTGTFRIIFAGAVVFAILAVIALAFLRPRPGVPHEREGIWKASRALSPGFKLYLIPAGIFSLAYFSFSFLLLRAYDLGFSVADVVLLYALFNVAFVIAAAPVGRLGDVVGRRNVVILSYAVYLIMSVGWIFATEKWQAIGLFILFGVFYSIDEAQSKAFIADIERDRRATAIGAYNLVTGICYLPASLIAGWLWTYNPVYAFVFAAVATFVAMIVFSILRPRLVRTEARPSMAPGAITDTPRI